MDALLLASALVSSASLLAWLYLVVARGRFWRTDQRLSPVSPARTEARHETFEESGWPAVSVVVPARNEADVLPRTLPSLLLQGYSGAYHVFLVDDRSEDGTAETARQVALDAGVPERLTVLVAEPLAPGWKGKLWALQQGVRAAEETGSEFLLLTDADIVHPPDSLRTLVLKAQSEQLDLVSLMVLLRVKTLWERLLLPAFVYFFAKLYPFRWANDPRRSTAAAAGGCVLVRRSALEGSGGLAPIAGELIDDCALAGRIKRHGGSAGGKIWLGLTQDVHSLRGYNGLNPIWSMVSRTAYAQLEFSPILLVGTFVGMLWGYLVPPFAVLGGLVVVAVDPSGVSVWLVASGLGAWTLMAGSYIPMLRWYRTSSLFAPLLPLTAMLYTLMTLDSALQWWRGKGGAWKGRTYASAGHGRSRSN